MKWKPLKKRKKKENYYPEFLCRCVCGTEKWIPVGNLKTGKSRQCSACGARKHGHARTRLYGIWKYMKQRCYNAKAPNFKWYGGRGIKVCKQWKGSFVVFQKWALLNGYKKNLTIERVNVHGPYSPKNCKWIPVSEQGNNRQHHVKVNGKNLSQWSKELGISRTMLQSRYRREGLVKNILRPVRKESSKYPGVSFDSTSGKKSWRVRFGKNGKVINGGRFETEEQAYSVYKKLKGIQ